MNQSIKDIYLAILKDGNHLAIKPAYPNMPKNYVRVCHKYNPRIAALLIPKGVP